jgi:hypothetical protein
VSSVQLQRRVQVVSSSLASLICLFALLIAMVTDSDGSDAGRSTAAKSAQGKQIALRGCLFFNDQNQGLGQIQGFGLVTAGGVPYDLVGNIRALPAHPDSLPVSVRGIEVEPPTRVDGDYAPGKLEVKHAEVFKPITELDKSLTDSSQWIRKIDKPSGLEFAVPKDASFRTEDSLTDSKLLPKIRVGFRIYPKFPEGSGGQLDIYVSADATKKDSDAATKKFERINGVKYAEFECGSSVEYHECGISTFQNNLTYSFEYSFFVGRPWVVETGCLNPGINEQQERSFIRLFLSQVAFFRPEVPAANP